ncbi:MAG TPA: molecular chaperone Skp [Bacteroidetes bacterium]|nr:molecular chaperone Skp [Bacteroidota bacterium]
MKKILMIAVLLSVVPFVYTQTKMAYINSATVMEQLTEAQDAQKQIDALSQQWQADLNQMANDMQKKVEDYDKRKLIMSDKRRSEVEKELQDLDKKIVDFRNQKFGTNGELFTKQNELMKPIQENIFKAVKDVADEEGYDYVVDRSSSTLLLFANNKHDLTQKIIQKLMQK